METKAFWKSKTLQGLAVAAIGMFLPRSAYIVSVVNEHLPAIIEGAGLLWAAYGRIKAKTKLGMPAPKAQ